ncbi:MAG: hypothetical protein KAW12_11135, partial [Candidatus Aminicenantes bacterium]|nr:hypothetical protein [Candidatus Aminicenantes bacterium]
CSGCLGEFRLGGKKTEEKKVNYQSLWEKLKKTDEGKNICLTAGTTIRQIEKKSGNDPHECWKNWNKIVTGNLIPAKNIVWRLEVEAHGSETHVYIQDNKCIINSESLSGEVEFDEILDAASILIERSAGERGVPGRIDVKLEKLYEALKKRGFPVEWRQEE